MAGERGEWLYTEAEAAEELAADYRAMSLAGLEAERELMVLERDAARSTERRLIDRHLAICDAELERHRHRRPLPPLGHHRGSRGVRPPQCRPLSRYVRIRGQGRA